MSAAISVVSQSPRTPINRHIFGYFIEHFHRLIYGGIYEPGSQFADVDGFRTDVADALRELGVPIVRWPGGCFVSSYEWLDGVGPERTPSFDKAWRVDDPNTFGTAEFVAWCELVGAEPYICTNAGTGTAVEMADWVEYCNAAGVGTWASLRRQHGFGRPLGVQHWSIGNENYGTWEMGAKGPEEWARFVTESAKMMRRVDPDIRLVTAARADLSWTLPLLQSAGPYLDAVAIHGYWDKLWVVDEPSDYLRCVGRSGEPEDDIRTMRSIIKAAGYEGRVSIAFDEWNLRGWHHPPGNDDQALEARRLNDRHETYTMADAIFSAGFLNGCIRNADVVSMANLAPLVNGRGPLYADEHGIVRRTTFHAMHLYSRLLGDEYVESSGHSIALDCGEGVSIPAVDTVATRNPDGTLVLALVNRHPQRELDCRVDIDGSPVVGGATVDVLAGDHVDAFNSPSEPERVAPRRSEVDLADGVVRLPAHSITILTVEDAIAAAVTAHEWVRKPGHGWNATESAISSGRSRVDWAF